jgi:hypothetical protein
VTVRLLAVFARQFSLPSLPRAGFQVGLASLLLLAGAGSVCAATAANETRTLAVHPVHSGEDLTVTFGRIAHAKPDSAAALRLASADAQLVRPSRTKQVRKAKAAVTGSVPVPRGARSSTAVGNAPMADIKAVASKGRPDGSAEIATSANMAAASVDRVWMRILLLSPSISNSASVTKLGNEDLTLMRAFFVKPQTVIKIGFSDDPMMGMTCDHFSGSTKVKLKTVSFAQHGAALQPKH